MEAFLLSKTKGTAWGFESFPEKSTNQLGSCLSLGACESSSPVLCLGFQCLLLMFFCFLPAFSIASNSSVPKLAGLEFAILPQFANL